MKINIIAIIVAALWACGFVWPAQADPVTTVFTYQGRLTDGGNAANGTHEFEFYLYDAATNGTHLGTQTVEEVPVTDGIFTVQLDFGAGAFNGERRWLEIWVRNDTDGQPGETLSPRQEITATPYAMMAAKVPANSITDVELANGAVTAGKLANGAVTAGKIATGAVTGANIANGAITNANISTGAIQSQNLAAGSVGATQLATGAVTSDKLSTNAAYQNLLQNNQSPVGSSGVIMSHLAAAPELLASGYLQAGQASLVQEAWAQKMPAPDAPPAFNLSAENNTVVWTGTEMLVWGGNTNVGGRYNPSTKTWSAMSTVNAPSARVSHKAIWTGTEMIVWGGFDGTYLNTGARYNPATNAWTTINTTGAPVGRRDHTAVWTGTRMIIWGGTTSSSIYTASGALYDPTTNTWSSMNNSATARSKHSAFWSAGENRMIVIAGTQFSSNAVDRYNPSNNTWSTVTPALEPTLSGIGAATWTSSEIIMVAPGSSDLVRFHAATNTLTRVDIPSDIFGLSFDLQDGCSIVWDGSRAVIWGEDGSFGDGAAVFNPTDNSFSEVSTVLAPASKDQHVAIWTGSRMIVWGGTAGLRGGSYDRIADTWEPVPGISEGGQRSRGFSQVWTGTEMLIWGGVDQGGSTVQGGLRYNLAANTWSFMSKTTAPTARVNHSAVWTGTEMIIWGGGTADGEEFFYDGARYNPSTDTWVALPSTGAPVVEVEHAVWTGTEMIVVGAGSGGIRGARYKPATNTWTALPTTNAPENRGKFAFIWTGTEAILWGGIMGTTGISTGARYNPASNTWTPMTTVNAPPGRANPAVAWTSSAMVIFGGGSEFGPHPTENARYNPITNTWAPISTTNALTARRDMAYAWDGSQIIAWGGKAENGTYPNNATHRRYVVAENQWSNISFASAPTPRSGAKAVWADTTMIIFGGEDNTGALAQTYTYTPQRTYFFYVRP